MSPRSARPAGTARIAVVGAPTEAGARLREALAEHGVPGERVDLYGVTHGEVVLSEYAGEARLIQEPDVTEIASHDVIFLCEGGELASRVASAAHPGTAIIDLADCVEARVRPLSLPSDIQQEASRDAPCGCFAVPHPLALLLAELLHPLEQTFGVNEAVAVLIRPASDFGEPGVEELRDQVVRLLSFAEVPTKTFGRQLAFNIIPDRQLVASPPRLETRIAAEVTDLLGWGGNRLALRLLTAPLFYGHGLQMRVRLGGQATLEQVRSALRAWVDTEGNSPATPLDVTEQGRASLAELAEDGLGGFWLWVVAGGASAKSADQAVRLAQQISDL